MSGCKVVTYNVKGLHSFSKRRKILDQLKQMKCNIAYLQETHLSDAEHKKLTKSWASQVFYSSHISGRRRGVAILIHRSLQFCIDSSFKDKEGRYVLVNGTINGVWVSMLNVYAPNDNNPQFMKTIFDLVLEKAQGMLLIGGDFNCVLNPFVDKSPNSNVHPTTMSRTLKNSCEEFGFLDVWRFLHPRDRDYTFYSHPHSLYSRIDYFFLPSSESYRALECQIHNITLSDHAPVSIVWDVGRAVSSSRWRLNTSLLGIPEFQATLRNEFSLYLEFNDKEDISPIILWEGAKAVLRGKIIQLASISKKVRVAKRLELEKKVDNLEKQHKENITIENLHKLKEAKQELDDLLSDGIERNIRFLKQKYYEHGSRASRLLASQLRKQYSLTAVQKIKSNKSDKPFLYKPNEISEAFASFYKELYSNKNTESDPEIIDSYLKSIKLPKIEPVPSEFIDRPITKEEIEDAIRRLKNNKSPGSDGYTNEFYKTFIDLISPLLERAYSHALEKGELPLAWKEAIISVIPKVNKDPTDCASYRPIALLNTDCKLLTSILAKRVESVITTLIHPDQTGFIVGRYLPDNIRRLLNVMEHSNNYPDPCMALAVDAEKAFDRVSWPFLFRTLDKFGFGPNFIKWVQLLYTAPQSMVRVNGHISQPFGLGRGTRQGCPLSPLLFALSIEPVAQIIREDALIKGIEIGSEIHKISLYADDVLVYVSDPLSSIPRLMDCLAKFGNLSGYKVNVNKTEALALNPLITHQIRASFSFKWPKCGITYLGTTIPQDLDKLYNANYNKLIDKISADLNRWTVLPLSFSGRIESIRMNVLPRLLFLFQTLPLTPPKNMFTILDRLISRFIWQGRRPRVRYKVLQLPKQQGGWGLPHLRYYWLACQLRALISWISDKVDTRWLKIEKSNCTLMPLSDAPFTEDKALVGTLGRWSKVTFIAWREVQRTFGLPGDVSVLSSIAHLKGFIPLKLDAGYKRWRHQNLSFVHQLIEGQELKTFEQLINEFNLPRSDFFRYLQVRSFLLKHPDWNNIKKSDSPIERYLIGIRDRKHTKRPISSLYGALSSMKQENTLHIKQKWERELELDISEEVWKSICSEIHKVTNANVWREFQWKVVNRFFRTPHILSKIDPSRSSACWRECGEESANHTHVFWGCPLLDNFWKAIFDLLDKIFGFQLPRDPLLVILGAIPEAMVSRKKIYLLHILLAAAKKAITLSWLKKDPPTYDTWQSVVKGICTMEKITFMLRLQNTQFTDRWSYWLEVTKEA